MSPVKGTISKGNLIFQPSIFRGHVYFRGVKLWNYFAQKEIGWQHDGNSVSESVEKVYQNHWSVSAMGPWCIDFQVGKVLQLLALLNPFDLRAHELESKSKSIVYIVYSF